MPVDKKLEGREELAHAQMPNFVSVIHMSCGPYLWPVHISYAQRSGSIGVFPVAMTNGTRKKLMDYHHSLDEDTDYDDGI